MSLSILYIINGLGTGGAERSLAEMLPQFQQQGIRPAIACFYRRSEGVQARVLSQGFDVRFLDRHATLPARATALRDVIRQMRPDLVHTTLFEADLAGRLAAFATRSAVLTSLVNTSYDPVRLTDPNVRASKLRVARMLDGWTARHLTDHFHAITHAVKRASIQSLGIGEDKITVVERGRDPGRLGLRTSARRRQVRESLGLSDDAEIILNVARQEYQKGQRYLLEAMPRVMQSRPQALLLIAGRRGNATDELRRVCQELGLDTSVRLLDHRDDVPDLLASADLFVFPSLYEGLGTALIEAMALGLPVVASAIPAVEEVAEEGRNAILVHPGSPAELAQAIECLLDDQTKASEFGNRSREIFEQRFTLERSVQGMIELYYRVASTRK